MAKRPAFQFYPGDWLRDTALRTCSVGARGLWIDMICLMHEGQPYGHLKVGDKVILPEDLARMVGAKKREVSRWLSELFRAKVYEKLDDETIYSRRMVRDEQIRLKRAAGGIKGGNPALTKRTKDRGKVGNKDNLPPNLQPTPSSSSASSSAKNTDSAKAESGEIHFKTFWDSTYRKASKGRAIKAFSKAIKTTPVPVILKAWRQQNERWSAEGKDRRYVPHPATWLNDIGWENEMLPASGNGQAPTGPANLEGRIVEQRGGPGDGAKGCVVKHAGDKITFYDQDKKIHTVYVDEVEIVNDD